MIKNRVNAHRSMLMPAVLAVAITPAFSAVAEEGAMVLEEIIVTAQKRKQTLQDVPGTVAAVSNDLLARSQSREFSDLTRLVSGVDIFGPRDGFGKQVRIRGVGTNSFAANIAPSVGVFVNDVPLISIESAFNNLVDVEQIEVLKGPQSTLFGRGVSSGAISITTKRPDTSGHSAYLETSIDNIGLQESRVGGNLALTDSLAVRGGLYYTEEDGTIENLLTGDDAMGRDNIGGRIQIGWDVSQSVTAVLEYEKHDLKSTGSSLVVEEYGDFVTTIAQDEGVELFFGQPFSRKNQDGQVLRRQSDTEVTALRVQWAIDEQWSLTSITAYQDWEQRVPEGTLTPFADTATSPFVIQPLKTSAFSESFTQEVRLAFDSGKWSSIIGGYYGDTDSGNNTDIGLLAALIPAGGLVNPLLPIPVSELTRLYLAFDVDQAVDTEEWGIFTHTIYALTEQWDITFGVRYSEVEKSGFLSARSNSGTFADLQGLFPFNPILSPIIDGTLPSSTWTVLEQSETWDAITGTLKLSYELSENVTLYGGYDRGFKAGGFNSVADALGSNGADYAVDPPFDEEIADAVELGMKGFFLDRRLRWNISTFYQLYSDFQVDVPDPITNRRTLNAAEVISTGIETDFAFVATERLLIDGNFSYVDAEFDKFENASCARPQYQAVACSVNAAGVQTQDLSGKRLNATARTSANLNTTYSGLLANGLDWFVRGEVSYRGDIIHTSDLDPAGKAPGYTLFNASIGLSAADERWQITAWGKNLGDKDYYTNIDQNVGDGASVAGLRADIGQERSYGLTLRLKI